MSENDWKAEKRTELDNTPIIFFFAELPWLKWPDVLPKTVEDEVLPLKMGIDKDLEGLLPNDEATRRMLRKALRGYTRSFRYLDALAADSAVRYNIDKVQTGPVSELDRHSASLELHRRAILDRERARRAARRHKQAVE
ncbi:ProQ/FinO family protein [Microvirga puerhi]|uniref:ProQ/FinO family protein n=1 Tax=Microvirga puerhi TaxID=2876078 RepID=A0ABS7VV07_9HYPH|nr:ProQ/FinO family protein [Microvirga puerhi]MBZ6078955.1 ProQ/FinO family protein [Microvirga puerhi]